MLTPVAAKHTQTHAHLKKLSTGGFITMDVASQENHGGSVSGEQAGSQHKDRTAWEVEYIHLLEAEEYIHLVQASTETQRKKFLTDEGSKRGHSEGPRGVVPMVSREKIARQEANKPRTLNQVFFCHVSK